MAVGNTRFTQLEVWRKAHHLALDVHRLSRIFPTDERYLLTHQIRRAAFSVPSNIAEGFGRRTPKDKARSYVIGQGSLEELRYWLIVAKDLGYVSDVDALSAAADAVAALLSRFIQTTLALPRAGFRGDRKVSSDEEDLST
jgi:four helix bundle protein